MRMLALHPHAQIIALCNSNLMDFCAAAELSAVKLGPLVGNKAHSTCTNYWHVRAVLRNEQSVR